MPRFIVEAGAPGEMWDGRPTYRISCRLETEAPSKEEAMQRWHEAFSEEEKAAINLETLDAFDVDAEFQYLNQYYREGRVIYFDGNNGNSVTRSFKKE